MSLNQKVLDFSPDTLKIGSVTAAVVPRYSLYGEEQSRPDWFVNVERLDRRCRERGWVIAPHTHPRFAQIMVCTAGGGEVTIEGESLPFSRGSVVMVPPFRIHGFRYTEEVDGWVLTIERSYLIDLLDRAPALRSMLQTPSVFALAEPALLPVEQEVAALVDELCAAWSGAALGSEIRLLSILLLLLRHYPGPSSESNSTSRRQALVERFQVLVEARYREQPSLSSLAIELGVSISQLRQACQAVLGLSPLAINHDRILSEGKRCLAYTAMSITGIAEYLGFTDTAYFSRFFTKAAGTTPTSYRKTHAQGGMINIMSRHTAIARPASASGARRS